ncbi:MAG: 7-cyano-7-deazaguanine synthase, partial [Endomicrobiales bacterium]
MKICSRCVLPETFPGIRFDENDVCNFCREFKGTGNLEKRKKEYRNKFENLLRAHKGRSVYDAVMCYSGGKDSTYTLRLLRQEYALSVLAVTFDNGFIPERTFRNIRNVVESLGVDHLMLKPRFDLLKKIFGESA